MKLLDRKTFQELGTFRSYVQLFTYLQEDVKKLGESEKENWRFVHYQHKLLARMNKDLQGKVFAEMVQEACQEKQNLILMCLGDAEEPHVYLATPDLDIATLYEHWCYYYCSAHGLYIES